MAATRIALIALTWSVFAFLLITGLNGNWSRTWGAVGVNALDQPFGDIRTIPDAVQLDRAGRDPYSVTPRTMNYPKVWIRLFEAFHLSDHVIAFALFMIALYLLCITHLITSVDSILAVVLIAVGALSSVSFLVVERGNNDMLAFSLTYAAAQSSIAFVTGAALLVATVLKFYPAVALLGKIVTWPKHLLTYGSCAVLIALYIALERFELVAITNNTPHAFKQSYGVSSIAAGLETVIHRSIRGELMIAGVIVFGACLLIGRYLRRVRESTIEVTPSTQNLFTIFSLVFLGTFLFTPNYEYRLIFTIPLLPLYVAIARPPKGMIAGIACIVLALLSLDNRVISDSNVLKAASYISRDLLFVVNSLLLGWCTAKPGQHTMGAETAA